MNWSWCAAVGCERQTNKYLQINAEAVSIRVPMCQEHLDAWASYIEPGARYGVEREDHRAAQEGEARDG